MYARKGANVAIVDCKDNVEEVAKDLAEKFGVKTIGLKCDVTKQEEVDKTVAAVVEHLEKSIFLQICLDMLSLKAQKKSTLMLWNVILQLMQLVFSEFARQLQIR